MKHGHNPVAYAAEKLKKEKNKDKTWGQLSKAEQDEIIVTLATAHGFKIATA